MKRLFVISIALLSFSSAVSAADTYTYEGMGTVTFNHAQHAKNLGCASCHEGKPQRIAIENKQQGHAKCLECHKNEKGNAPTKCSECHIR